MNITKESEQYLDSLKDKLRLTPDSNIKRVKFNFRVNWSKVFKRGWLLWKN